MVLEVVVVADGIKARLDRFGGVALLLHCLHGQVMGKGVVRVLMSMAKTWFHIYWW